MRRVVLMLGLSTLAFGATTCSSDDPCDEAKRWGEACGLSAGGTETDYRARCEQTLKSCSASQKSELAAFYGCLADKKICDFNTSAAMSECGADLSVATAMCLVPTGCSGTPLDCDFNSGSETECAASGCTWGVTCSGSESACTSFHIDTTCVAQQGCVWSGSACTGTAAPCSSMVGATACPAQDYCFASTPCTGTPTVACEDFSDATSCDAISGCHWY
jgi:hypothetical protein